MRNLEHSPTPQRKLVTYAFNFAHSPTPQSKSVTMRNFAHPPSPQRKSFENEASQTKLAPLADKERH
jgi:hypothetical protein